MHALLDALKKENQVIAKVHQNYARFPGRNTLLSNSV